MYFTQEDYRKIEKWLLANSKKDTQFVEAATPLQGNETIAFVQNGKNVKTSVKDIVDQFFLLGVSDFLNITDKYGEKNITINQAIQLIPFRSRKIGQVITFIDEYGNWAIYQFQGKALNQWNNTTLWINILGSIVVSDVVPDEEDITGVKDDDKLILKFANKKYNLEQWSGLGRTYLRKNITTVIDSNTGKRRVTNLLSQNMIPTEDTIYILQYDYDLNGQTVIIPNNSIILFEGGSISNGILNGAGANIISVDDNKVILGENIIISGTWNIPEIYDSWFAFDATPNKVNNQLIINILALSNDNVNNTIHFEADRTYYFELPYKGRANLGDDIRPDYWKLETEAYAFLRIFTGLTSNTHLIINNTLQMLPTNQGAYSIFHVMNKQNIEISGTGSIIGDAKDHQYTDPFVGTSYYGEWGYGFNFRSCSNIVVRDITVAYCFGDGFGFSNIVNDDGSAEDACHNITIDNAKVTYARRNGISLGGANYSITNVYFEGNGSDAIRGTAPMAAIDFENDHIDTNPTGICQNVVMSSCEFKDNKYDVSSTIRDDWTTIPDKTLVTINGCNFTAPLRLNRTHGLTFNNCHIPYISSHDNSINAWSVSSNLKFISCIFDELNPYLTTSALQGKKTFVSPVSPEDIRFTTSFYANMVPGKAIKFTIPKPVYGEVEMKAFVSLPAQANSNTTKYRMGNTVQNAILDIEIGTASNNTPDYRSYDSTPVFSYIDYTSDTNNYIIYFVLGGELIGKAPTTKWIGTIFLTSKTKYVIVSNGESPEGTTAISGGVWSKLANIQQEYVSVTDIPSTVKFPSKEMYKVSLTANLPDTLDSVQSGKCILLLDGDLVPVYWNSFKRKFYTADGKTYRERYVKYADLAQLATVLTLEDRNTTFWVRDYSIQVIWDGYSFQNPDGTQVSKVTMLV